MDPMTRLKTAYRLAAIAAIADAIGIVAKENGCGEEVCRGFRRTFWEIMLLPEPPECEPQLAVLETEQ